MKADMQFALYFVSLVGFAIASVGFVFYVGIRLGDYCTSCRHDWEAIETQSVSDTTLEKRVCLKCGLKDDRIALYKQRAFDEEHRAAARKELAKALWER